MKGVSGDIAPMPLAPLTTAILVQTANTQQEEWLDYRDAAKLMHRPQDYFRIRLDDGSYKYWPEIERWQPGGRGTRLYVRHADVEVWIERSRTPAPCPINQEFTGVGYESLVPVLRNMGLGGERLMRSLGIDK
jgi:hypothetical protein